MEITMISINILFYFSIYVSVAGRDKYKGINIDDLFYVLSLLVKWKRKNGKIINL